MNRLDFDCICGIDPGSNGGEAFRHKCGRNPVT